MNLLKKKFPLFIIKNVYFCKINNTKVLVLCKKESNDSQYIIIPNFILYEKFDNFLVFSCSDVFTKEFDLFLNFFTLRLKCFEKNTRKKILLTGLGFRVNFSKGLKCLEFKIGLSHIVSLEIPVNFVINGGKSNITIVLYYIP